MKFGPHKIYLDKDDTSDDTTKITSGKDVEVQLKKVLVLVEGVHMSYVWPKYFLLGSMNDFSPVILSF